MKKLMGRAEPSIFWRNLALVASFFVLTPVVLVASLIAIFSINPSISQNTPNPNKAQSQIGARVYASLPAHTPSISGYVTVADARPEIVKQYLKEYNSPLVDYANKIVEAADKYGIDYRFLPAIAQQESNLCKIIPYGSYNCWGWGITGESTLRFNSYDEAIDTVTKGLKKGYIDEGLTTPLKIMAKYTPSSNGSWAHGVSQFMAEIPER